MSIVFYCPRLVFASLVVATAVFGAEPEKAFPGGAAAYVVQVEGKTAWTTVWSRQADRALPPASLTKIMTALLVLESRVPLDGVVAVSANAQRATGTRLKLKEGEQLRVSDLLAASLLNSANDACVALAEHVAGSKEKFVAAMNQRAQELGLTRTNFSNPCGHDEPKHRSSARDLAELAKVAMRQPLIAELSAVIDRRISTLGGRSFDLVNSNEIVGRYRGAIGLKTGWTPAAGPCLVALAQRDGATVLLVVLNAPNRWWDAVALLDRVFEHTTRKPAT